MSEVQVAKDEAKIEPMTSAQFHQKLDSDSAFRKSYLDDPGKYEAAITDLYGGSAAAPQATPPSPAAAPQAPAAPGEPAAPQGTPAPAAPAATTPDEMVQVSVPKSMLGSYLMNRTPQDAALEALKGNQEKDAVIALLRRRDEETHGERLSLREELQRMRSTKPAAPQPGAPIPPAAPAAAPQAPAQPAGAAPAEVTPDDLNLDDLPDDDTLFEPANVKKLVAANKRLAKWFKDLNPQLRQTQEAVADLKTKRETEDSANAIRDARNKALRDEFAEIEELQTQVPILKTSASFADLDRAVVQFVRDIGYIAGVSKGDFDDAAATAANRFFNDKTPAGDELRKKCVENGIKPPEGIAQHQEIMRVRNERRQQQARIKRQMEEKAGRKFEDYEIQVPLTYTQIYRSMTPQDQAEALLRARIEGAQQAAAAQGGPHAREVPPEAAHRELSLENATEQQVQEIMARPSKKYSGAEARLIKAHYEKLQVPVPPEVAMRAAAAS